MINDTMIVVTHSGDFHSDEIFACAVLSLYFKDISIIRSREQSVIDAADIVVDVGGEYDVERKRFDHHQIDGSGERDSGIPYASFGLVWKEYGKKLCNDNIEVWTKIDAKLVSPIDAGDNGIDLIELKKEINPYTIGNVLGIFKASWSEDADAVNETHFFKMLEWSKEILEREIFQAIHEEKAKVFVEEAYKTAIDKKIILLDGMYPSEEILSNYSEPLYVVRPRSDGKWGVKCIRTEKTSFSNRKDLPKEWSGLRDEEFQKVSGVMDAIFCHRALFLAIADSREGALELARLAVEY